MSGLNKFKEDFDLWAHHLKVIDGYAQEEIEEIRSEVRAIWVELELRRLWIDYVANEADFVRSLQSIASGITDRIKANAEQERLSA